MYHSTWIFSLLGPLFIATAMAATTEPRGPDCSQGDSDIIPITRQQPYYPHSASMFCLTGRVKLEFMIDEQGIPRNVEVIDSEPEAIFDRAAVSAVETWRFIPACREGRRANRRALQTIEFQLPASQLDNCPEDMRALEGPAAELIGEIGARYAMMAEYWRNGGSWSRVAAALKTPFGDFTGDLQRVVAYHQRTFEDILRLHEGPDLQEPFANAFMAVMPESLALDPDLDTARNSLDTYRDALERRAEAARNAWNRRQQEYQRLRRTTQLDPQMLELLVKPFLGDIETSIEPSLDSRLRPARDLQALIDFLESRRGQWRIADNDIHFQRKADELEWLERVDALVTHRDAMREQDFQILRMFKDYSD
ncbi:MAG: energy transducer TonB [Wenzhouxiangella sp.]|jgi:protein TonB|nr:energy transducer TonB [Wenzhouxiangella sp.]